jgi:hypothetical protein
MRTKLALGMMGWALGCAPAPQPWVPEPASTSSAAASEPLAEVQFDDEPFGPGIRSLRVKRSIAVRQLPDPASLPLGTVAQDTRVAWRRTVSGPDCDRWVEIEPEGFICDRHLEPNVRAPRALELPRLADDALVPGEYASLAGPRARLASSLSEAMAGRGVRSTSQTRTIRKKGEVTIGRRQFWRTVEGEWIDARALRLPTPSAFSGIDLLQPSAPLLPFAWVQPRGRRGGEVTVWEEPQRWLEALRLPARSVVPVLRQSPDGKMVRIGRQRWVQAQDLRVARLTAPPAGVGPDERWVDVDLDQQVLVAYQGARPVFATLVSSGTEKNPTPAGEHRIWIKFAERDMTGEVAGRRYLVASVPWTMFYAGDFALHAAYWHDRFGETASSGCVNLSPQDARFLYFWTTPEVPAGWTMAHAGEARPGSLIRLRRGDVPAGPPQNMAAARRP